MTFEIGLALARMGRQCGIEWRDLSQFIRNGIALVTNTYPTIQPPRLQASVDEYVAGMNEAARKTS